MKPEPIDFRKKIKIVAEAKTDDFIMLVKLSGYNPATDFQYRDLNDADFGGCSLAGFNFTGSRLTKANFKHAKISGAIFDGRQLRLKALKSAVDYKNKKKIQKYYYPILDSILKNNEIEKARLFLANVEDINNSYEFGSHHPLAYYSLNGNEIAVALIIDAGAEIDLIVDGYSRSALICACEKGAFNVAKILIEAGADINLPRRDNGCTPLIVALENGNRDIVQMLIEHGADVNLASFDSSALTVACEKEDQNIVQMLIDHGADVNQAGTNNGFTALMMACQKGHEKIVKILIEYGANVNQAEKINGRTPLMEAIGRGHHGVMRVLLENGANPLIKTRNGLIASDFLPYELRNAKSSHLLRQAEADWTKKFNKS